MLPLVPPAWPPIQPQDLALCQVNLRRPLHKIGSPCLTPQFTGKGELRSPLIMTIVFVDRVAAVRFGPVRRPFCPNPEPEPGSVRALRPNPEPLWGPVWFRSGSGPDPFRTLDRTRTANFALLAYVITKNSHIEVVVYRKKRRIDALW